MSGSGGAECIAELGIDPSEPHSPPAPSSLSVLLSAPFYFRPACWGRNSGLVLGGLRQKGPLLQHGGCSFCLGFLPCLLPPTHKHFFWASFHSPLTSPPPHSCLLSWPSLHHLPPPAPFVHPSCSGRRALGRPRRG